MKKFECTWENITKKHYEIVNRRTNIIETEKEKNVPILLKKTFGNNINIIEIKEITDDKKDDKNLSKIEDK